MFEVVAIISIGLDINIVLTKVIAEIWKQDSIARTKCERARNKQCDKQTGCEQFTQIISTLFGGKTKSKHMWNRAETIRQLIYLLIDRQILILIIILENIAK